MKSFFIGIFLMSTQVIACPNFSGKFNDSEGVLIEFTQSACSQIVMFSNGEETILKLDGQERLHQKGAKNDAYLSAKLEGETLVIQNVIRAKSTGSTDFTHKMVMTYKFESKDLLKESTQLFNSFGLIVDAKEDTLKRRSP